MIGSGLGLKGIKNFRSEVKTDKKNSEKKEKIITHRFFLFWGEFFKFKKKGFRALNLRYMMAKLSYCFKLHTCFKLHIGITKPPRCIDIKRTQNQKSILKMFHALSVANRAFDFCRVIPKNTTQYNKSPKPLIVSKSNS